MRIGITYDLRSDYLRQGLSEEQTAELDREETIEAIEGALASLGHQVDRIGNIRQLVGRLAQGVSWDLVFNIAEGLYGLSRESQVPALLDAYRIPYTFSDPLVLGNCLYKAQTKRLLLAAGVRTAEFVEIKDLADLDAGRPLPAFPLFAKPVAEGTSKGISARSIVNSRAELFAVCSHLLKEFDQPVLVERYLPGREFTVGITGTGKDAEVLGTMEVTLGEGAEVGAYSFENKKISDGIVFYNLVSPNDDPEVKEVEAVALLAWRALECRDSGRVDIRSDAVGKPHFIEVNPLAGLNPTISDLCILCAKRGVAYRDLIARILDSATRRMAASSAR